MTGVAPCFHLICRVGQTNFNRDYRWGKGVMCKHGDFYTCTDRYNPGVLQV